jgi:hypothetical protein
MAEMVDAKTEDSWPVVKPLMEASMTVKQLSCRFESCSHHAKSNR